MYTGNKGTNGARPLGYWLDRARQEFGDESPAVAHLNSKIQEVGAEEPLHQTDLDVLDWLERLNDAGAERVQVLQPA